MKKYVFEGYTLFLQFTGKQNRGGEDQVKYKFLTPDKEILFEGADFFCSPLIVNPESKEAAISLLGFLTLRKGDTDADWFKKYTPAQLQFSRSQDCENLQLIVFDYENGGAE